MQFEFHLDSSIPPMAWALVVSAGDPVVRVALGRRVEYRDRFFVEGAWESDFEAAQLESSVALMGSGAVLREDDLIVCAPSHTTECVYSSVRGTTRVFSNSLSFLLAVTGDELNVAYLDYESDILSISDGIHRCKKRIPTRHGWVNLHYFMNVRIQSDGRVVEEPKARPVDFENYEDYVGYLRANLKGLHANAVSPQRKYQYLPIVFLSRGYDSSACAALGRELGCTEAVTFETKKKYRSDNGSEIARVLGYQKVHEKQERAYLEHPEYTPEFVASGELGTSIFFAAAAQELEGRYLLSGVNGGNVWERDGRNVGPNLIRRFYPDTARKEFRLRVGYINVPVPYIGAVNHPQIHAISNSDEMKPWSVGGDYDRPIPRRIVEEAGVPRHLFGTQKGGGAGSSLRFGALTHLRSVMSAQAFEQFSDFYGKQRKWTLRRMWRSFPYAIYLLAEWLRQRRKSKLLWRVARIDHWPRHLKCSPWAPSLLFHWGTGILIKRYRGAAIKLQSATSNGMELKPRAVKRP